MNLYTLRTLRESKGYSQEYLARRLGMSQNNYSKIELGKVRLSVEHLELIAGLYGLAPQDLLEGKRKEASAAASLDTRLSLLEDEFRNFKSSLKKAFGDGRAGD